MFVIGKRSLPAELPYRLSDSQGHTTVQLVNWQPT